MLFQFDAGDLLRTEGSPAERRFLNLEILRLLRQLGMDGVNLTPVDQAQLAILPADAGFLEPGGDRLYLPDPPSWSRLERSGVGLSVLSLGRVDPDRLRQWRRSPPRPTGPAPGGTDLRLGVASLRDVLAQDLVPLLPSLDILAVSRGDSYRRPAYEEERTVVVFLPAEGKHLGSLTICGTDGGVRLHEDWIGLFDARLAEQGVQEQVASWNRSMRTIQKAEARARKPITKDQRWAGAGACDPCHPQAAAVWNRSRHAHAVETLRRADRDFDPICLPCHVTGWNEGYSDPLSTPEWNDVQCEACHGPGRAHAEDPSRSMGPVPVGTCQACHNEENSPGFDLAEFWGKIQHR